VELLVSITILGIIMVAITGAVILGLNDTANSDYATDESNAAQFTASYFTRDVESAETISVNDSANTCGGAAKLKLTSTSADTIVAYAVTASPVQLVRRECSPSAATPFVTTLTQALASSNDVTAACTASCTRATLTVTQPGAPGRNQTWSFTVAASTRYSP
jgi:hypothetical protein